MPESRKYNRIILLVCFFTSFLVMMICTKASFLYPLQDWGDDNILFTIGRGVLDGKVIYRDLYDHKGPLTYFLYAFCAIFSRKSFIGLYVLESFTFGIFLFYSWKSISLFEKNRALYVIPLLAALTASSDGFNYGGSVEELVLPFLAFGLYTILRCYKNEEEICISKKCVLLNGIMAGCIFWIKFSMLGFHLGWIASIFIYMIIQRKTRAAFCMTGCFLAGALLTFIPILLYFYFNRSLSYLMDDYFIKNLFGYASDSEASFLTTFKNIRMGTIHAFKTNAQYTLLIVVGILYLIFSKCKLTRFAKGSLVGLIVLTCTGIFFREYVLKYHGNLLMTFACLGFIPIIRLTNRLFKRKSERALGINLTYAGLTALSVVLCYCLSLSSYMIGWKKSDLPQYQFAKKMNESKTEQKITLLSYDMLDSGFYLASGAEPISRFFTSTNYASPELIIGQNETLNSGTCEFIVTMNEELIHSLYEQIDSATYYYEQDMQTYYLYQRK